VALLRQPATDFGIAISTSQEACSMPTIPPQLPRIGASRICFLASGTMSSASVPLTANLNHHCQPVLPVHSQDKLRVVRCVVLAAILEAMWSVLAWVTQHHLAFPAQVRETTRPSVSSVVALDSARRHVLAQLWALRLNCPLLLVILAILSQVRTIVITLCVALLAVSETAQPQPAQVLRPPVVGVAVVAGVGVLSIYRLLSGPLVQKPLGAMEIVLLSFRHLLFPRPRSSVGLH
jgi:hypothetical protein